MELLSGQCTICENGDKILTSPECKYYLEFGVKAFFENHPSELENFQKQKRHTKVCYLCAFKMELSNTFKEQYEKTVIRQMTIKKTLTECFICDTKDWKLIKTESEPGQFSNRIAVFMSSVLTPRAFKQCAICMYCLYHFHIWYEVRTAIFSKLNTNSQPSKKVTNKDKRTVTPSTTPKTRPGPASKKKARLDRLKSKNTKNSQDSIFKKFLDVSLASLVSPSKLKNIKHNPKIQDKRLFEEIPYILIRRNSQVSVEADSKENAPAAVSIRTRRDAGGKRASNEPVRVSLRTRNAPPTKEVKNPKRKVAKKTASAPQSKKNTPIFRISRTRARSAPNLKPVRVVKEKSSGNKAFFKIKGSTSFVKAERQHAVQKVHECTECHGKYKKLYEYKAHLLTHEKHGSVVIKVERVKLPQRSSTNTQKKKSPDVGTIKTILTKYVGKIAADVFDESNADLDLQKSVDEIINILDNENENSPEKSQETESKAEPMDVDSTNTEQDTSMGEPTDTEDASKDKISLDTTANEKESPKPPAEDAVRTSEGSSKLHEENAAAASEEHDETTPEDSSAEVAKEATTNKASGESDTEAASKIPNEDTMNVSEEREGTTPEESTSEVAEESFEVPEEEVSKIPQENALDVSAEHDGTTSEESTSEVTEESLKVPEEEVPQENALEVSEEATEESTLSSSAEELVESEESICDTSQEHEDEFTGNGVCNGEETVDSNSEMDLTGEESRTGEENEQIESSNLNGGTIEFGTIDESPSKEEEATDAAATENGNNECDSEAVASTLKELVEALQIPPSEVPAEEDTPDLLPAMLVAELFRKDDIAKISDCINENLTENGSLNDHYKRKRSEMENGTESMEIVSPAKKKVRFSSDVDIMDTNLIDNSFKLLHE